MQVYRSIKMTPFSFTLTRTPPGRPPSHQNGPTLPHLTTRSHICTICCISSNAPQVSSSRSIQTYNWRRYSIRRTTTDVSGSLAFFPVGAYIFLDRSPLSPSSVKRPASEVYDKILPRNNGPDKMIGIKDRTVPILQGGLENTAFIHFATLRPT